VGGRKIKKKPVLILILLFAMICINIFCTSAVSAATIKINSSSDYKTTNNSLNEQIQSIINSAKSGDTLEFLGKSYGNLSLIINKSLNIISLVKTVISGNSSNNSIFLVTGSGSRWTNITGFNLQTQNGKGIIVQNTSNIKISKDNVSSTNGTGIIIAGSNGVNIENSSVSKSQTGISVTNSKNINITNNSIQNNKGDGIGVGNSQNLNVSKNSVSSNGNYGTSIEKSQNISMQNNSIENNGNNGVSMKDTNKIHINGNNINGNQGDGIYFDENVNNTQIASNNINYNVGTGIELDKSGINTLIVNNVITGDLIGVDINDQTDNLIIRSNIITDSIDNGDDTSGVGINIGSNYVNSPTFNVYDNYVVGNQRREVIVGDPTKTVKFGANWYGFNNGGNICPYLRTGFLNFQLSVSNFGITGTFTESSGSVATGLPTINVNLKLNGNFLSANVINGIANAKFPASDYKLHNNVVTAQAPFPPAVIMDISDNIVKSILANITSSIVTNCSNTTVPKNANKGGSHKGGTGKKGSDGGSDTGSGSSTGASGQVGVSSSTTPSKGTSSVSRESASLSNTAEDSSTIGSDNTNNPTAQDVSLEQVENPNILSIISLVLIMFMILIGYYRNDIMKMYKN
jgi:parallel beta-helix repeat protein